MHPSLNSSAPYPARAVLAAMILVLVVLMIGSAVIDWLYAGYHAEDPAFRQFRATCYWIDDSPSLNRIALYGYTDYLYDLRERHITYLPDRSWWPVFPILTAGMIALIGDGMCANWTVNALAVVLLVPVIQGIIGTRRFSLLAGLMIIPYALWLYVGMAEGVFLLVSGLLWLVCLQWKPGKRRHNLLVGAGALLLGILAGLTKPNSLALMPAFLVMALLRAWAFWREARAEHRAGWIALLDDASPLWPGLLATAGIALGNGLWFYQTSGYYPFYVLMAQRTLWFKQFYPGDLGTMFEYFAEGIHQAVEGHVDILGLERLIRLSAPVLIGILAVQGLPPRWPGLPARRVPAYARFSLLAIVVLMFLSGQTQALPRYAMGNIFFVVLYLQYVYGTGDEPPVQRLPGIVRQRQPGAFTAGLRLCMLALGPLLTTTVLFVGPRLGI